MLDECKVIQIQTILIIIPYSVISFMIFTNPEELILLKSFLITIL